MVSCTVFAPDCFISSAVIMVDFRRKCARVHGFAGQARARNNDVFHFQDVCFVGRWFFRRRNEREAQAHGANDNTNTYTGKQSTHDTYLPYARRAEETELSVGSPGLRIVVSLHLPV